jgi:hypothetical protein
MADLETIEAVKEIDVDKYKYGFETMIEYGHGAQGPERKISSASFRPRRASPSGCRLAPRGLSSAG